MAGINGSAPRKSSGGSGKKKSNKQKQQMQQLAVMAGVLVVCAVLVTWTVLLMKDRYAQNQQITEQNSVVDFLEVSRNDNDDPEETRQTAVPEFTERTTSTTTTGTGTETVTTKMTNATAPKRVTVQSVSFSKIKSTSTKSTSRTTQSVKTTSQSTSIAAQTTHTTAQQLTMNSAPTASEIPYNELLALYLGAQTQGNTAYFFDSSVPTVVLCGEKAYYAISPANEYSLKNVLGGTGDADENPWQTGTSFQFKQYEDGDPYIYYASSGAEYQVLGYYNMNTNDNVWARLHYYQVGVDWQVEYHIFHSNRPNSLNGTLTEIHTGTSDAEALYESAATLEQLEKALESYNMSAGSWNDYKEIEADQQNDALWNQAGSHNSGFAPQSGETYAVVRETGNAVMYAEANPSSAAVASLPAGTLVSIPKNALPLGTAMVSVQAKINGTWISGYMQPEQLIAWSEE